jgi:hypothetical protein
MRHTGTDLKTVKEVGLYFIRHYGKDSLIKDSPQSSWDMPFIASH